MSFLPRRHAVLAWTLMWPILYNASLVDPPSALQCIPFFGFGIFSYALGLGALFCFLLGLLLALASPL